MNYFNCKDCGEADISKFYTSNLYYCRECAKRRRRERHKATYQRKTTPLTPEQRRDRYNAYHRKYRLKNKTTINQQRRDNYQHRTPEQIESKRERSERRNKLLHADDYKNVTEMKNYIKSSIAPLTCSICLDDYSPAVMTVDHITPICKGGTNEHDNLQITCIDCNKLKGTS